MPEKMVTVPPPHRPGVREPSVVELESFLPRDSRALRGDLLLWCVWLVAADVVRVAVAVTGKVVYPRLLGVALVLVALVQVTAWLVTRPTVPWASQRVRPFLVVAAAGTVVGLLVLDAAGTRLLPWSAVVVGSVLALAHQVLRRRRWATRARARWRQSKGLQ